MSEAGTLAAPVEFDEKDIFKNDPKIEPGQEFAAPPARRLIMSPTVPTKAVTLITGGNRKVSVEVVDKGQWFTMPKEELRTRWFNVVKRPSGKVLVYDRAGAVIARFEDWAQAKGVFEQADILKAVTERMEAQRKKREREEAIAKQKADLERKK